MPLRCDNFEPINPQMRNSTMSDGLWSGTSPVSRLRRLRLRNAVVQPKRLSAAYQTLFRVRNCEMGCGSAGLCEIVRKSQGLLVGCSAWHRSWMYFTLVSPYTGACCRPETTTAADPARDGS
jgi:hypothetical protein